MLPSNRVVASSMNQYFTLWVLEWNIGGRELAVYFVYLPYLPKQELIQLGGKIITMIFEYSRGRIVKILW